MADELTADDLRNRLYHSLREKGLVDSLKSQLRNKLVTELKHIGLSESFHVEPKYSAEGSLLLKAANSLVSDHLRRCGYDYTLSVFLPETGTADTKIFTTRDLLQLLHISPHSKLYKHIAAHSGLNKKGFLWQLLCELASQHGYASEDSGVQTDPIKFPVQTSLDEAFNRVDQHYASISDDPKTRGMAVEERLLSYQRQLDERSRTEVSLEVARFKENELARVKLQEREKTRKEVERLRKEMERTYKAKADALSERERNSIERLQKQLEMVEKETFTQRQSILQEIDMVRQREAELRREGEAQIRERQLYEDNFKSTKDLLKKREENVRRKEIEFDQRMNDFMNKFKLEEQGRYTQRYKELEVREARSKSDQRKLDEELQDIQGTKDELREKRINLNEAEAELHKARLDLISSEKKNEIMSEKLRQMVDYQVLKEENAVLRNEVDGLKMRLAEVSRETIVERQKQEDLLREMTHNAGKPAPESVLLQRRLDKARDELRQQQAISDHQKQQLDKRLEDEVSRSRELTHRYEEQTVQMKEMNHEISDLRQQLRQTRAALDNEVYRKPKGQDRRDSMCEESDLAAIPNMSSLQDLLNSGSDSEAMGLDYRSKPRKHSSSGLASRSDDLSYSMELVHETKHRLKNLEREAENLEKNYRNFQYRMTNVPTLPQDDPLPVPVRTHVSFPERPNLQSPMASPQLQRSTKSSARRSLHNTPGSRPLSSTPYKVQGGSTVSSQEPHTPPGSGHEDRPLMDLSVSTVHSMGSPLKEADLRRASSNAKGRPLSLDDLEARPGDPSVVVLQGSDGSPETQSQITQSGHSTVVNTASQQQRPPEARSLLLDNIMTPQAVAVPSLDDAWKSTDLGNVSNNVVAARIAEEVRLRQEEEDREWEEGRRRREEERKRKEEEAWEREQRELQKLQQNKNERSPDNSLKEADVPGSPPDVKKTDSGDASIDPVMQKYMAMVQQQKDKEKTLAKKTVDTWNKGKLDRTPSHSEPDLSVAEDTKSGGAGALSDDDFDW